MRLQFSTVISNIEYYSHGLVTLKILNLYLLKYCKFATLIKNYIKFFSRIYTTLRHKKL